MTDKTIDKLIVIIDTLSDKLHSIKKRKDSGRASQYYLFEQKNSITHALELAVKALSENQERDMESD